MYPGNVLQVPLPQSQAGAPPVDLQVLLQQALALPQGTNLQCQQRPAPCSGRLLNCNLVPQQGEVQVISLVRGIIQRRQQVFSSHKTTKWRAQCYE